MIRAADIGAAPQLAAAAEGLINFEFAHAASGMQRGPVASPSRFGVTVTSQFDIM